MKNWNNALDWAADGRGLFVSRATERGSVLLLSICKARRTCCGIRREISWVYPACRRQTAAA